MRWMAHKTTEVLVVGAIAFAVTSSLLSGRACAATLKAASKQSVPPQSPTTSTAHETAPIAAASQGVVLDRLVAVVNGDVILESDVDEERRFEEIQPYRRREADKAREKTIERLIDRTLILQQAELEPENVVSDKDLDDQLTILRRDIPDCKQYHCETSDGWTKFLADHGFAVEEFRERWRKRMELLKFIEVRFQNGIKISDTDIKQFYETRMLPEYAKRNVTPPKLDTISKRIEEVLLQQQVSALLVDWLKSLRVQGSVKIMTPGEVAP